MKRWALRIIGVLLGVLGLVWGLQGIGVLQGNRMTGDSFWAWAGLVALIAGTGLLYLGVRQGRPDTMT